MRRVIAGVLILGALIFASSYLGKKGYVTIHAQTLPAVRTLTWNPNPVGDAVINYTVQLDGATIGNPTVTQQAVTFNTVGTHTLSVSATNAWGTGPAATLIVNVVVPGTPQNLQLK